MAQPKIKIKKIKSTTNDGPHDVLPALKGTQCYREDAAVCDPQGDPARKGSVLPRWDWAKQAPSKTSSEHDVFKRKRPTAGSMKRRPVLRNASSRRNSGHSDSMDSVKDAGLEPGRPPGPGSSNGFIHQRVLS